MSNFTRTHAAVESMHAGANRQQLARLALTTALALFVLTMAACSPPDTVDQYSDAPQVTFVAREYSYEGPETIPAGVTELVLDNQGEWLHQMQLMRLDDGKTMDDFWVHMAENPDQIPEWATAFGGPNAVMPGMQTNAFVDLEPGLYVITDNIPAEDGVPQVEKGMLGALSVTEAQDTVAQLPAANVVINGSDFSFEVSEPLTAGSHSIAFDNVGNQGHEVTLVLLDEGNTAEDFLAAFEPGAEPGPPPGATIAGVTMVAPGMRQVFNVDLVPGHYALLCFVPDPNTGAPHFALGMSTEFDVS